MKAREWMIMMALVVLAAGCANSGGSSPTQPATAAGGQLTVSSADLLIDGVSVAGQTMQMGHGQGMMARFEAHLMMGSVPAPGYPMWCTYDRPMGMGPQHGSFALYDDGTHGDRVAGDGVYCFEDPDGMYACNRKNAMQGNYHYDFWGLDHAGHETNHMGFTVHLDSN